MRIVVACLAVALVALGCGSPVSTASPSATGSAARPDALPGVSIEVDAGWGSGPVQDGRLTLVRTLDRGRVTLTLARVTAPSATEAARAVATGATVLATSESRMSGLTGPNLELENATDADLELLVTPSGPLAIDAGSRLWLSLFDTSRGVVAVAVHAPTDTWDAALLAAEPLLEGVVIEP